MTTREWLSRARNISREIEIIKEESEQVFIKTGGVYHKTYDDKAEKSAERNFAKYSEYSDMLNDMQRKQCELKIEIAGVIFAVPERKYRLLLFMRYIRYMTWEKIAEKLNYSVYWTRTALHNKAVCAAERIIMKKEEEQLSYSSGDTISSVPDTFS